MDTTNKNKTGKVLKILPFVFGGITLVFVGLFVWKVVTSNKNSDKKYKLTFAGEDCQLLDQDKKIITEAKLIKGKTYNFTLAPLDTNLHDLPPYVVFDDKDINYTYNNKTGELAVSLYKDALLEASAPYCVTQFIGVNTTSGSRSGAFDKIVFGDTKNDPVTIDWGDKTTPEKIDPSDGIDYYNEGITHEYAAEGTYTVTIRGAIASLSLNANVPFDNLFMYHCKELIFGDRIRTIGNMCCTTGNYEKIIVSEGVNYIDTTACASTYCTYLKLPSSLQYLGEDAFAGSSLKTIVFAPYTDFDKLSVPAIAQQKGLFNFVFQANPTLKTIYIGRHSIWHSVYANDFTYYSFDNFESLVFADPNDRPTVIGNGAFSNCSRINVDFLEHVTYIGDGCFSQCGITSVTFSPKLTYIGHSFAYETFINKLVFTSTMPPTINPDTFFSFKSKFYDIIVPKGSLENYKKVWTPLAIQGNCPEIILNLKEAE